VRVLLMLLCKVLTFLQSIKRWSVCRL